MLKIMINFINLEICDHVRISKCKNMFAKGMLPIGEKTFFLVNKLKLLKTSCERVVEDNKIEFKVKKNFQDKSGKLCLKLKGYDDSFNFWI